ncbi:bifunctional precorrin-2 dehydrogenase/sirohydrochlorin ferrochelatase [Streptomyces stramineus]
MIPHFRSQVTPWPTAKHNPRGESIDFHGSSSRGATIVDGAGTGGAPSSGVRGEPGALRHLARLCRTGAEITVVAPVVCAAIGAMAQAGRIRWHNRSWQPEDLDDTWYAVACTPEHNAEIAETAERKRVFCARADAEASAPVRQGRPDPGWPWSVRGRETRT